MHAREDFGRRIGPHIEDASKALRPLVVAHQRIYKVDFSAESRIICVHEAMSNLRLLCPGVLVSDFAVAESAFEYFVTFEVYLSIDVESRRSCRMRRQ